MTTKQLPDLTDEQKARCSEMARYGERQREGLAARAMQEGIALGRRAERAGLDKACDIIERAAVALGQETARDVQAEPVAWQSRPNGNYPWMLCSELDVDRFRASGDQVRALYAAPPASDVQAEPVALDALRAIVRVNLDDVLPAGLMRDRMVEIARNALKKAAA